MPKIQSTINFGAAATTVKSRSVSSTTKAITTTEETTVAEASSSTTIVATTLESLERDTMGKTWLKALDVEFTKPYFKALKTFLASEYRQHTVYPPMDDIYSWSRLTPLNKVKVVILGQDPYHNVGQAHGLSFSVLPPTKPPGSLLNIYKQLKEDFPTFVAPPSGNLTPLAELGVLWLNTSLTVRAHNAASHSKKGWEKLTAQAIRAVITRPGSRGVVFLAWGLPAQSTLSSLKIDKEKHLVLTSAHPSPLSAHRGFIGNGHFRKTNEWLEARYGEGQGIDWSVLCPKPA